MSFARRVARPLLAALPLIALVAAPVLSSVAEAKAVRAAARPAAAPKPGNDANTPWLYRGSDVPQDKEWTFGELPNGLRYAVRHNGVPPGQVSIRVRIDAGALNESDAERGYAHLLEHLVFRQSKWLGDGEAIAAFQRLGATFGSDTNAETSPTATTFKIDLPEATPVNLDEAMRNLSGMVTAPTLSDANILADLPIVLAEKRERGGAEARVQDAVREVLYAGQPLAQRAPIGTDQTLAAARAETVRAFHARWYRPENTVVVLAGDRPVTEMAALVNKWFGDWKGDGPRVPTPSFGDPRAPADALRSAGAPVGEVKVLVEPDLPRSIQIATLRPWRLVNDTIAYNQGLMVDQVAQAIINRRLESRARGGGSFLTAQVNQQDVSRSTDATYVSITPLTADWQAALKDVRGVIADALAAAPSKDEIAREVAEMDVAFASSVEQRDLQPGSRVADDIVQAVDIRETVAAPETVQSIFRKSIPLLTPAAVLAHTRQLFAGTVTRAVMIAGAPGEGSDAALKAALAAPVAPDAKARLASKPVSFDQLPPIGQPGTVLNAGLVGLGEIQQVDFANGVKALVWPSGDEPGRVTVKVRFGAGYRAFASGDAPYILLGSMALPGSGMATLGQDELDRISTGRKMGFNFQVDDSDFTFSADTRQADLADQLYLFAAKFAQPRWDPAPVIRAKAAAKLQYDGFGISPGGVLARDLKFYQHGQDPRYRTPTPAELEAATPEGFRQVWEPILASGPIEVQVFGDIDAARTIAALTRTFGALPERPAVAPATLAATAPPPAGGGAPIVVTHRGDANQAAALVSWPTGGGMAGVHESRQLQVLGDLFTNRLLDRMREKLGASYSPQVMNSWPVDLASGGSMTALAQLQPKDVDTFFTAADEIAADLVARPASADELARVIEPLRQQITRSATGSAFYMYQLEGATADPSRIGAIRSILPDYTSVTAATLQQLAQRYLVKDKSWRLAVVPDGKTSTR